MIERKSACALILTLSLACGALWGQEPAVLERPTPESNPPARPGNDGLPGKQSEHDTTPNRTANPPGEPWQFRNQLIRDRMRDYAAVLDSEFKERIIKWDELFLNDRQSGLTSAVQEIVLSADRIRKTRSLDASELKNDAEFHQLLAKKITEVLNPERMKAGLANWAKGVEMVTRTRMIECFQQIIAEDLGRTFDESLSNQVIKAVRAIPIEVLVAQADSSARIEQAILASLPESSLSATTRKTISASASALAKGAASVWATSHAMPTVAPLIAGAAGEITRMAAEAALRELDERITQKPDPNFIHSNFEQALRDWNAKNLDPRLESILSDFRRHVIEHVEDQARKQSLPVLP